MRIVAAKAVASRGILIRVSRRKFILVIEGSFDVACANNGTAKSDVFFVPRRHEAFCARQTVRPVSHCASTTSVINDDSSNGTCSPLVDLITSTRTRFITPPISRPGVIMCLSRAVVNGLLRPSPSSAT